MNWNKFIFSNKPRYRISRHVFFWLCWFVFVVLAFHIPMQDMFPNWNIKARMEYAKRIHGMDFITLRGGLANLIWEVTYKQMRILLCHMAFTYAILYYILPRYISNNKIWITTGKLILVFIAFFALSYFVVYLNTLDAKAEWAKRGIHHATQNFGGLFRIIGRSVLFNLSTLVGLTVAFKLMKRWWLKQKETEQVAREKASAELQLLKAQIHPHFLFNSLNNIYSYSLEATPKAPEMIQKLTGLLHYMLYECKQSLVPLEKELKIIKDYISLEKIRYGDRLKLEVNIQEELSPSLYPVGKSGREVHSPPPPSAAEGLPEARPVEVGRGPLIAPLLLIPFVENSFKHGTSRVLSHPWVNLDISVQDGILYFMLNNSRPSAIEEISVNGNHGLGLRNIMKRLTLLYPGRHELQITDGTSSYTVCLKIVLSEPGSSKRKIQTKKEVSAYELA